VGLALAGASLYWENMFTTYYHVDEIVSGNVGGGPTTAVVPGFASGAIGRRPWGGVAADGTSVYWAFGSVWKCAASGGRSAALPGTGGDAIRIAVDATSVFWTDLGSRVMKLTPK
jgi:hypothetical protein